MPDDIFSDWLRVRAAPPDVCGRCRGNQEILWRNVVTEERVWPACLELKPKENGNE
jgi:hypothetical protein